ncbi:MAG TPA: glycoside hydrolase domain-containing protein, partial [Mycobacteriales bacterium]|nr:glycoside hydrolase domain-containing protein [Mycobacteriales bacterium]
YARLFSTDPAIASVQGAQAADDAIARAEAFGLPAGSPIYFDMESYDRSAAGCSTAVLAFLSSWTQELHTQGWTSGAYGSGASLVTDLSSQWGTGYAEPDDLWFADWNNLDSEYGDPYVPDSEWAGHRRIHQWHGGANESHGGVTLNIDRDGADGQVVGPAGGDCTVYPAEDYGPDGCDGALSLTGPLQYWRFGSPYGERQSMRWTYGTGAGESDGATWAPPQLTAGVYDLSAWVPSQHSGATAHYTVTDADGAHSVSLNQTTARGTWAALGEFTTGVSGTISVHVGDDTSTGSVIGVDAMKFHFVHAIDQQPPTGSITAPSPGSFARPGAPFTLA